MLLEEIFKEKKEQNSAYFNLRVQRGISWLKKARDLDEDLDFKFISLLISFNTIYAQQNVLAEDQQSLECFFQKLYQADHHQKISRLIWKQLNSQIRTLLNNPFIFQGFWDYQNRKISQETCQKDLAQAKQQVEEAFEKHNAVSVLSMLFGRFNTLHQQILKGGASYNSYINRKELENGAHILSFLIPTMMQIFIENAQRLDVGQPYYPAVQMH